MWKCVRLSVGNQKNLIHFQYYLRQEIVSDQMREREKKRFYYFHTNALLKLFPINLTYTNTIFIVLINKTYLFPLASTIHRNPFYKENLIQYLTKKLYKLKTLSEIHLFFSNLLLQKSVRKNATFRNIVSSLIRF